MTVRVGSAQVALAKAHVSMGSTIEPTLDVPLVTWRAALENREDLLYETLLLVTRIDLRCATPDGSDIETRHFADAFIGGFASGE